MLFIIGLGLSEEGFSFEAYNAVKHSRKVYLEGYTVDFPYKPELLEEKLEKRIKLVDREFIENEVESLVLEAKEMNVALLVYGNPLVATTHMAIIDEARKKKVSYRVIQAASIFDAVGETGLSLYKFGKVGSMPSWQEDKGFSPESFIDTILENQSIYAHSLLLIDIGLSFSKAIEQLERACKSKKLELDRLVVCSRLGTKRSSILVKSLKEFKKLKDGLDKDLRSPYCFVIPSDKLNQMEEEALKMLIKRKV